MRSVLAHRWACLVVLTGISTTLATPLPDDLLAFASSDTGSDIFTTQPLSFDVPQDISFADDFSQDPSLVGGNILFDNDPILEFNPSLDSSFDVAVKVGDCVQGEYAAAPGTVDSPRCSGSQPLAGCSRPGTQVVVPFSSQLPSLCAAKNQFCCSTPIGANTLGGCDRVAVSENVLDGIADFFSNPGAALGTGVGIGAGATPSGGFGLGSILGWRLKKRDLGFCPIDFS